MKKILSQKICGRRLKLVSFIVIERNNYLFYISLSSDEEAFTKMDHKRI